jgi:hypothetical protein
MRVEESMVNKEKDFRKNFQLRHLPLGPSAPDFPALAAAASAVRRPVHRPLPAAPALPDLPGHLGAPAAAPASCWCTAARLAGAPRQRGSQGSDPRKPTREQA